MGALLHEPPLLMADRKLLYRKRVLALVLRKEKFRFLELYLWTVPEPTFNTYAPLIKRLENKGYITVTEANAGEPSFRSREYCLTDDRKLRAELRREYKEVRAACEKLLPIDSYFKEAAKTIAQLKKAPAAEVPKLVASAQENLRVTKLWAIHPLVKQRIKRLEARFSRDVNPAGTTSGIRRSKSAGK